METIEKAAKVTLNRAFKMVKNLKFKTSEGVERPPVLSIRTSTVDGKASSTPGELMRPVSGSSGPALTALPLTSASLASALGGDLSGSKEAGAVAGGGGGGGPAIRSNFSFGQTEKGGSKAASAAKQVRVSVCLSASFSTMLPLTAWTTFGRHGQVLEPGY